MNGSRKTLSSSTTGPSAPTETRAICSAPTCACSIISFSPPSCICGYLCSVSPPPDAQCLYPPPPSPPRPCGLRVSAQAPERPHRGITERVHVGRLDHHLLLR